MKSTLPVTPDSYIPLSSHNHEITQTRRYGMDAYTAVSYTHLTLPTKRIV